jgi:hypothetical protein
VLSATISELATPPSGAFSVAAGVAVMLLRPDLAGFFVLVADGASFLPL